MIETRYLRTRHGPLGTMEQANAAAAFYAKTNQHQQQKPILFNQAPEQNNVCKNEEVFPTNFRNLVHRLPPLAPSSLLRKLESFETPSGLGKIRIMVRVAKAINCYDPMQQQEHRRHFQVDAKRKQITLFDPSAFRGGGGHQENGTVALEDRKLGVAAPKMFAFDGLFTSEDSQEDMCATVLPDAIHSVMNGMDGCVFCFGHANLGKTRTMLGSDECSKDMGVIPIAIAWLYRAIKERKRMAKFSVRVSALEITSQREDVRDLLKSYEPPESDQSPAAYLRALPSSAGSASVLQNLSELRASSAEKAAFYLDAALAGRSLDAQGRESHLVFTIHVYQCALNQQGKSAGVIGGRSRLHLIDFGGCERTRTTGGGITLSGLGNVILAIFNGQKHLPCRDSKVTQVLKECLGSLTCQATMLAHVSPEASHYSETLHTVQLASRLHRMRRKRLKASGAEERRRLGKLRSRSSSSSDRSSSDFTSGTSTNASSSELSCDTVVYRGHSDGSGTDSEHPPIFLPHQQRYLSSGGSSGGSSAPGSLRGSLDEIPRPRRRVSGSKILTNGAIASPRRSHSPQPSNFGPQQHVGRSPHRSLSSLPVIHEVNTNSRRKMPLNGLVPVQGRQRGREMDQQVISKSASNNFSRRNEQWVDVRPSNNNFHASNFRGQGSHSHSDLKQIWVDGSPADVRQQIAAKNGNNINNNNNNNHHLGKYSGSYDEQKANMISSWVETQKNETKDEKNNDDLQSFNSGFRALTQFKTCDRDFGLSGQDVIVHPVPTSSKKPPPPPPPPRLTPPRESNKIVYDCQVQTKNCFEDLGGEKENPRTVRAKSEEPAGPEEHPLRILSEENLTIVSSFAGSLNDLGQAEDDHETVDPSKLSFFEVPDFNSIKDNMDKQDNFICERFKEFAQLERALPKSPTPCPKPNVKLNNENPEILSSFSKKSEEGTAKVKSDDDQLKPASIKKNDNAIITPQRQFQLLAESLRHPDGSSNPELNVMEIRRSPGNGRSTSDAEEEMKNVVNNLPNLSNPAAQDDKSNVQPEQRISSEVHMKRMSKKESSRFSFRFFKLFGGSTRKLNKSESPNSNSSQWRISEQEGRRSKSCDRKTDHQIHPVKQPKNFFRDGFMRSSLRSATSSPSIKTMANNSKRVTDRDILKENNRLSQEVAVGGGETPSILSLLSTDWEYQENENDVNRVQNQKNPVKTFSKSKSFSFRAKNDRKSSGYDSFGGESSSVDSTKDADSALKSKLQRCESLNQEKQHQEAPYATPTDANYCDPSGLSIVQYDEVDILRMEQRSSRNAVLT